MDREVVATALTIVDRYLFTTQTKDAPPLSGNELGVILVTCLLLAIKAKVREYAEGEVAKNIVRSLCTLIGGGGNVDATSKAVFDMEEKVLKILDWRINPPTMQEFVRMYVDLHPVGKFGLRRDEFVAHYLNGVAKFQVEQALLVPELIMNYTPSIIALAALLRAEEQLDNTVFPFEMRESETFSMQEELKLDFQVVDEALSALENYTEKVCSFEEFEAESRNNAAASSGIQEDVTSPVGVYQVPAARASGV